MTNYDISDNNQSFVTIILSERAGPQERNAANELLYYLERMTGACFSIEEAKELLSINKPAIAFGEAALWLGLDEPQNLGEDGFVVKTINDSVAIYGGCRGIFYGTYEFLEQLGCRFFTPHCEKVPTYKELKLPYLDIRHVPVFEYRYLNYIDYVENPIFAVKRRINGPIPISESWGGHLAYAWFVHTFEHYILDPRDVFDDHPEYFSLVDGKRLRERSQLCLTNPDVLRISIDKVKSALTENPHSRLISVSQNDWANNCKCDNCQKIDGEQGSHAGSLIWFVNQVAEAIEEEFPHVIVDTLAYRYTRPAPASLSPRQNVCVRLCTIEACFAHPFEECHDEDRLVYRPDGTTATFIDDLRDWAKVSNRLYVWDYTTCFAHYPMPFPNWNVLQPNMQAFVENNVKGVFEQSCGAKGGSTDLNELRTYLLTKLLWDPDCNYEEHMNEFLNFFYGAAGPIIREYIKLLTDIVEDENIHIGFNDQCDQPYLTPQRLDQYDAIMDRAAAAVSNDPIRFTRVDKARLSLRWVRVKNKSMLQDQRDTEEINQLFNDWKAHGLTRIDEWVSEKTTHKALQRNKWRGTEFYKNWWDEGKEIR